MINTLKSARIQARANSAMKTFTTTRDKLTAITEAAVESMSVNKLRVSKLNKKIKDIENDNNVLDYQIGSMNHTISQINSIVGEPVKTKE